MWSVLVLAAAVCFVGFAILRVATVIGEFLGMLRDATGRAYTPAPPTDWFRHARRIAWPVLLVLGFVVLIKAIDGMKF